MSEQTQPRQTLGKKLKEITAQAVTNVEAQTLYDLMKAEAEKGKNSIHFDDLRSVAPNMIQSGILFSWLNSEEIIADGFVDQNTAAYNYTLSW